MQLAIISDDRYQTTVLAGAAERRGWTIAHVSPTAAFGQRAVQADAVIVDLESVDMKARDELAALAGRVGRERVFLLAERIAGVLPWPGDLHVQGLQMKPFYPGKLLRMIEASVPVKGSAVAQAFHRTQQPMNLRNAGWVL